MNCLVTGGSGFIGTHLVKALSDQNHKVISIDRKQPPKVKYGVAAMGITHIIGDLFYLDLEEYVKGADAIFHLAGTPGVMPSWDDYDTYVRNNIQVTQRVLQHVGKAQRVIFASSSTVYEGASPYGVSKIAAEALCRAYKMRAGFQLSICRFFSVYGPGQRPDQAFAKFFQQIRDSDDRGNPRVELNGDGLQARDFTYVDDIVTNCINRLTSPVGEETLDFGYGTPTTLRDALKIMSEVIKMRIEPVEMHRREAGDVAVTCARNPFPLRQTVDLREGLKRQWEAR